MSWTLSEVYVPANDIRIYTDLGVHQEITLYMHIYVYIYYLFAGDGYIQWDLAVEDTLGP